MKSFKFPKKVHFGGGAWACINYIGMAKRLYEKWDEVKKENPEIYKGELCDYTRFSGDSVGAVIACYLALGLSIETMKKSYIDMAKRGRDEGVLWGKISKHHDKMLDDLLYQRRNTLELLHKRDFNFGITNFFGKYYCCEKWTNLEHLRESLHCGFYIPFYCKYRTGISGTCLDGGFSNCENRMKGCDLTMGIGEGWSISINPTISEIVFPPLNVIMEEQIIQGYNSMVYWEKNRTAPKKMKSYGKLFFLFMYVLKFLHWIQHKLFCYNLK
jgi:hypothetical protein